MKIVFKNEKQEVRCLVQLRDIKYLAQRFDSDYFEDFYENEIFKGHIDTDFIEITYAKMKEVIIKCPFIVDFTDFASYDLASLSRFIVLSINGTLDDERDDNEHKRNDLLDIIEFKKGSLPYQIPVTFDNKVFMDLGAVYFGSSTIPGYYMLKKKNIHTNLMDFLYNNYYLLHTFLEDKDVCSGFESFKVGDELLFRFTTKTKLQTKIDELKKKFS